MAAKSRSSALANQLGIGATGAKRRKASGRALGHGKDGSETDAALKVFGGGQSLVDDFNDEDFEARKVIVELIHLAAHVGISGVKPALIREAFSL